MNFFPLSSSFFFFFLPDIEEGKMNKKGGEKQHSACLVMGIIRNQKCFFDSLNFFIVVNTNQKLSVLLTSIQYVVV
jgi:hypothetical protein